MGSFAQVGLNEDQTRVIVVTFVDDKALAWISFDRLALNLHIENLQQYRDYLPRPPGRLARFIAWLRSRSRGSSELNATP